MFTYYGTLLDIKPETARGTKLIGVEYHNDKGSTAKHGKFIWIGKVPFNWGRCS
jgi:hypothetical protein